MAFGQEGSNQENVGGFTAEAGDIHSIKPALNVESDFMVRVFAWMALGLTITGIISFALVNALAAGIIRFSLPIFGGLVIAQLALWFYMVVRIHKLSSKTASIMFFIYSVVNGIVLTPIFLMYTGASIASTFVICAGTFGATAMYAYTTKKNLIGMGPYLLMAIIGFFIASVVNIYMRSAMFYWIAGFVGVILSIAITAYNMQVIKGMARGHFHDDEMTERAAVSGAFFLYLNFISLFVHLLRFTGNRR